MREIKFRGRDEHGEWHYGAFMGVFYDGVVAPIEYADIYDDGMATRVLPDTVGQFTGLKDCKGREIYEGDIIEMNRGCYERDGIHTDFIFHAVVCWVKNGFMYKGPGIFGSTFDNVKVIGNVHDNPELLEVEA